MFCVRRYWDDVDITIRHSIWTQVIGQVFIWLPVYGSNQMAIQRYYAVSSTFKAQMYVSIVNTQMPLKHNMPLFLLQRNLHGNRGFVGCPRDGGGLWTCHVR